MKQAYLLSHAGIKKRIHTITWFGDLSYSKLKIEKLEFKTKCPDCDEDFQRLVCFQDGFPVEPPPIPFEFSDNHEGWKYWLRPLNFPTEEDQSIDYSKRKRYGLLNPR